MANFNPRSFNLPAADIAESVNKALSDNETLIVTAPPGAGKSTLLPLSILQSLDEGQKVYMLEPRRLAARQIATRMAQMLGEEVGQTVGYRVRFESRVSSKTRIEVLTEGILTRMLHSDNELKNVGVVIFDEFHERSLFADVALALCRECQSILRPDLKIVIMSATVDTEALQTMLSAPVIESKGRMYDVETVYTGDIDASISAQAVAHVIREAYKDHEGDILAFLPGEAEIKNCAEMLSNAFEDTRIHQLYGSLPQNKQHAAIMPDQEGKRKIVLATPIAETSLTIEGITIVVDSGLCRQLKFDPNSGLSRLETARITLDMADQRRGRAGRLREGTCYRLWSKATESNMKSSRTPEIEQADLSQLVLDMAVWGETKPERMTWLTPPPQYNINTARELLLMLDAVDAKGRITPHGRQIAQLPCHPRIAKMLLSVEKDYDKALGTDLAALLDDRDPMPRETGIDINLRIEALRRNRRDKRNNRAFDRIEKTAEQYRHIIKVDVDNGPVDCYATGTLIAAAYPERIASAHPGNNAMFRLSNGNLASASHTDSLAHEQWLAVAHMDARDGNGRIHLASPLDPTDLKSLITERDNVQWDNKNGCVVAQHETRIGRLVLSSKPIHNIDREKIDDSIIEAVAKNATSMLDFNDETGQMQARIMSLKKWNDDGNWPDVTTEELAATADTWLRPYLGKASNISDLKKINIGQAIHDTKLDYEQQMELDELAPTHITVPSGSRIKLQYNPNGTAPVLAVRLQECFGLGDTPTVDKGKQRVMMHLLSPGFKPVQITQDLGSFWNNAYHEVRKELRNRYPKHVWPDDPWTEKATRKTKPKN